MKISGREAIPFPVGQVWDALLDPAVLVRTIPGCERLETTGDHTYAMTVTAGVAAIRGTYDGTCALSDLKEHESLVMRLQGAGAPGTIDATVQVSFRYTGSQTVVEYDADAVVGGMVGGVGQRMLTSTSRTRSPRPAYAPGTVAHPTGRCPGRRRPTAPLPRRSVRCSPRPLAPPPRSRSSSRASPSAPGSCCSA